MVECKRLCPMANRPSTGFTGHSHIACNGQRSSEDYLHPLTAPSDRVVVAGDFIGFRAPVLYPFATSCSTTRTFYWQCWTRGTSSGSEAETVWGFPADGAKRRIVSGETAKRTDRVAKGVAIGTRPLMNCLILLGKVICLARSASPSGQTQTQTFEVGSRMRQERLPRAKVNGVRGRTLRGETARIGRVIQTARISDESQNLCSHIRSVSR
jgi:hypothetical protein